MRAPPKDLTPKSTGHKYVGLWEWDGTLARIHHALFVEVRELVGKEASPYSGAVPVLKEVHHQFRFQPLL